VAEAPAASVPTFALPTTAPPSLKSTLVAAAAAVPWFFTVAESVTGAASLGDAGVQVAAVTIRSGFGAAVPSTWKSATCPPGAPVLLKICSCTSATRPVTGMVTAFWLVAGLNV
jgi:hypothetical protein